MQRITTMIVCAAAMVATPAMADEPYAIPPSGMTETYFPMRVVDASDHLANKCLDAGWTMVSSTETVVVCEVPMSFGSRLLSALAAPRYSTPPRQYFRFNMAGIRGNTRVQATAWQETQTAFGQNQRTDLASNNYHNSVMNFFESVGGIYPPGTQFPNHAMPGSAFEFVKEPVEGIEVTELTPGGAFERAGIVPGDVVTRLARERTKNLGDLLDGLHKAIRAETYEVEFQRGGETMKVGVAREFRPAVTEPLPEPMEEVVEAAPATMVAPMSVADELAKFAKLRDDGIISAEEFEAAKLRLLAD